MKSLGLKTSLVFLILNVSLSLDRLSAQTSVTTSELETIPIEIVDSKNRIYDGLIEVPPQDSRNGYAVMMLGGGLVSGIDWEVPPILSISGNWIRDGKTIAAALLDRGFVVMRWSSIYRGDPKYAADPLMADAPRFEETVEHARLALATFRKEETVPENNIFLLGHSLGAKRAAILLAENPKLPGLVFLAGASLISNDREELSRLVEEARTEFREHDRDQDGKLGQLESAGPENKTVIDIHEYTVRKLSKSQERWHVAKNKDRFGFPFGSETINDSRTPTLSIVGSLDKRWVAESYAMCALQRSYDNDKFTNVVVENLGHQLGKEKIEQVTHPKHGVISDAKVGPIDTAVVERICNWLDKKTKTTQLGQ